MKNLEKVTRIEEKYVLSTKKKEELLAQFRETLLCDEYSDQGKYSTRTLYFDTPNSQDYQDKLNNKLSRKGIRMRIYTANDKTAKIELKAKDNLIQNKTSLKMSKEDAQRLINKDYECLKNYNSEIAKQLYEIMKNGNYAPKTLILYDRYAFKDPKTKLRVTIDSNLSTSNTEFDLWDTHIDTAIVSSLNEHILEIKKQQDLPKEIENIIYSLENKIKPQSKYQRCCKYLTLGVEIKVPSVGECRNDPPKELVIYSQSVGKVNTTNGKLLYEGEFVNALPHGKGKLFSGHLIAEGNFYQGKLDGKVKITDTTTHQIEHKTYWRGLVIE